MKIADFSKAPFEIEELRAWLIDNDLTASQMLHKLPELKGKSITYGELARCYAIIVLAMEPKTDATD